MVRKQDVVEAYDRLASRWDTYHVNPQALAENEYVFRRLLQVPSTGLVLDLACGTGLMLDYVADRIEADRYLGLDISGNMIDRARRKWPQYQFIQGDIDDLARCLPHVEPGSVSLAACCWAGWSYLERPAGVLEALRRLLRPGGQVFLMPYGPATQALEQYSYPEVLGHPIDRRIYTADMIHRELIDAGYRDCSAVGLSSAQLMAAFERGESPDFDEDSRRADGVSYLFTIGRGSR